MKYTAATLALLAGLAAAHDDPFNGAVPHCAIDCLVAAIKKVGCAVDDPACACTQEKQSELAGGEFPACLTGSCNAVEVADAAAGGVAICDGLSASGTAETPAETGAATSGAGNSTATATSGKAEPTGDDNGDDDGGSDGGDGSSDGGDGGDSGSDGGSGGDSGGDDSQEGGDEGGAAAPAIFGGAAILAALLAL